MTTQNTPSRWTQSFRKASDLFINSCIITGIIITGGQPEPAAAESLCTAYQRATYVRSVAPQLLTTYQRYILSYSSPCL